ncbi:MAG: class I SAM-dependent methyltransferase, partial [Clostridia bacterium]|nr:class I SAM-dependent methyltransferase [Clostridia bacterium]
MEEKAFVRTLSDLFAQNGQTRHLSHARSEAFFRLTGRLLAENEKYNLTAVTDVRDVILLHYIDSLTVEPYLPRG